MEEEVEQELWRFQVEKKEKINRKGENEMELRGESVSGETVEDSMIDTENSVSYGICVAYCT